MSMVSIQCEGGSPSGATTPPICTNGIASTIKLSVANIEKCTSCNSAFGLDGEICKRQVDPTCTNGIAASTGKVFEDNSEKCTSCNNYYVLKSDKTCKKVIVETFNVTSVGARLSPIGIAVDRDGFIYFSDEDNSIRKITSAGVVSTLAGGNDRIGSTTECGTTTTAVSSSLCKDGTGTAARFFSPGGIAVYGGFVYVADIVNNRIRKITSAGVVSTLAGDGGTTKFNRPAGIAVYGGFVYVTDADKNRIRKITISSKAVTTLAGSDSGVHDFVDDTGTAARFNNPRGVAVDGSGNIYVADAGNNRIRKITSAGVVTTLAGDGGTEVFSLPSGIAFDVSGNIYVADTNNRRIRKIIIPQ